MAKTSAKTKNAASKQSVAAQASTAVKVVSAEKDQKPRRTKAAKAVKPTQKDSASPNKTKKSFGRILATPFLAIGRYFKGAFSELRQTRFPNRRAAWKMTLLVILYTVIFLGLIMLLDMFFGYIFNKMLG